MLILSLLGAQEEKELPAWFSSCKMQGFVKSIHPREQFKGNHSPQERVINFKNKLAFPIKSREEQFL